MFFKFSFNRTLKYVLLVLVGNKIVQKNYKVFKSEDKEVYPLIPVPTTKLAGYWLGIGQKHCRLLN